MHARPFATARVAARQRDCACKELHQGVAKRQPAVVAVHAAENVDNTGFPVIRFEQQQRKPQHQRRTQGNAEALPAWQGLEVLRTATAQPQLSNGLNLPLEGHYRRCRQQSDDQPQQGIGQQCAVVGKIL